MKPIHVGIDIAARSFDLVVRQDGRNARARTFKQTGADHARVVRELLALHPERVVMEASGVYHLDLAVALHRAGLPVSVINPRSFRHFAHIKLVGSKTDPIDSALLAEYAERIAPSRWRCPTEEQLALRDLGRQINRLGGARTQAKNRLHALRAKGMTLPLLIEDEEEGIERLDQRIERLKQAALELIATSPQLSTHLANLCAAKGIGHASAIALLAELCVLPEDLRANQVSRFAGLDVRLTQSGSSVSSPGRLSKAGNAYLRAALFMPALSASLHDEHARAFYQRLIARGKKKIQAQCALMRKMLTGIWACIRGNVPFDSASLFSDSSLQT